MSDNQVAQDLNFILASLEHALTYPSTFNTMSQLEYQAAHKELGEAITRVKRIKRVGLGSNIGRIGESSRNNVLEFPPKRDTI